MTGDTPAILESENWRNYPIFAELITDRARYEEMRGQCLSRCRSLDETIQSGDPGQREMAQQTLNTLGFALGLLDEAIAKRDEIIEQEDAGGLR